MKCPFCKQRINKYDGYHIYKCDKNKIYKDKKETKYQYLLYNFPFISDKNNLFIEYTIKMKSLPDLKKEYNINYNNVIFLLDYFNFKKRSLVTSSKQISVKKYKKTCLKKYGKDNYSKLRFKKNIIKKDFYENKEFYDQIKDILLSRKTNILKHILERDNILKKETKDIYKKYYKYWQNLTDEKKNELVSINEILETKISDCLDKLGATYIKNFFYGKCRFDFKINDILIDVNSDYWGANPTIYKENNWLNFPFEKIRVSSIWNKERCKKNLIEKYGYKLVIIWESDIKNLSENDLLLFIIKKLI